MIGSVSWRASCQPVSAVVTSRKSSRRGPHNGQTVLNANEEVTRERANP
jgi:hypothetical protein